jgi:hypothetical protein
MPGGGFAESARSWTVRRTVVMRSGPICAGYLSSFKILLRWLSSIPSLSLMCFPRSSVTRRCRASYIAVSMLVRPDAPSAHRHHNNRLRFLALCAVAGTQTMTMWRCCDAARNLTTSGLGVFLEVGRCALPTVSVVNSPVVPRANWKTS